MADNTEKKILIDVEIENAKAIKAIAQTKSEIDKLRKAQKELDTTTEEGREEWAVYDQQIKALNKTIQDNQKQIQNEIKLQNESSGSLEELKSNVSLLTAEYNRLSEADRQGAKGEVLRNQILDTTNALKEAEAEIGNYRRNVGDYENAMKNAIKTGNPFVDNLIASAQAGQSGSEMFKAAAGGVQTLGQAFKALLSNPIVLVLAAVVAIFSKLMTVIKGNEEQSQKLAQAMAPLQAIGDVITRIFEKLAGVLLDAFGWLTKIIGKFTDFVGITDNAGESTAEYVELEKAKYEAIKRTRELNEEAAKTEQEVSDLRSKVAQKDKYTHQERLKFLDEAIAKETDIAEKKKALAEENLRILEQEGERTKNSAEFEEKLSQARIAVVQSTTQLNAKTRELNAQRVEALNAIKAETKAEQDAYKARQKEIQDANLKILDLNDKFRQEENKLLESAMSQDFATQMQWQEKMFVESQDYEKSKLDLLKEYGRITDDEYQKQYKILELQEKTFRNNQLRESNKYYDELTKTFMPAVEKSTEQQIEDIKNKYSKLADIEIKAPSMLEGQSQEDYENSEEYKRYKEAMLNLALYKVKLKEQEADEIKAIQDAQLDEESAKLKKQYDSELLRANDDAQAKYEATKKYIESELELYKGNIDKEIELQQQLYNAEMELFNARIENLQKWGDAVSGLMSGFDDLMKAREESELQRYEEDNEKKKESLEQRLKSGLISQEEYDKQVEESDKQLDDEKKKIERQQAIRQKALKAFDIITSTASGIMKAVEASPLTGGLPFSAIVASMGALQLATVIAEPLPKASRGMLLNGASHAQGGVAIEAEGGEAIINKRSTSMFAPLLSAINVAGGGIPFVHPMSDGGYVNRTIIETNGITKKEMKSLVDEIKNMKVYMALDEFHEADLNYNKVINNQN